MPQHPRVVVPDIGPLDHAWDLLGDWQAELELEQGEVALRGTVTFRSWSHGDLVFDQRDAVLAGVPATVTFTRTSPVTRTDAGGGALEWRLLAPEADWSAAAILWPGALVLRLLDPDGTEQVAQLRAARGREYYARKYPG